MSTGGKKEKQRTPHEIRNETTQYYRKTQYRVVFVQVKKGKIVLSVREDYSVNA